VLKRKSYARKTALYRALVNCWSTAPGLEHDERHIPAGTEGLAFEHLTGSQRQYFVDQGVIEVMEIEDASEPDLPPVEQAPEPDAEPIVEDTDG